MKVLLTGGSGFVGGAIARELIGAGHEVVSVSRRQPNIAGLAAHIALDLGNPEHLRELGDLPVCDVIVHAAAQIDMSAVSVAVSAVNATGTHALMTLAWAWDVQQVVYLSSVPVIGMPQQLPITEGHPTQPITAYHASKLYGEHLMGLLPPETGALSLRLTSPVGPGMPNNRIFSVFVNRAQANEPLQLVGKGTRRQNYVDVRDVAALVAANLGEPHRGVFNVAGAQSISNAELAYLCVEVLASSSEVVFLDKPDAQDHVVWEVAIEKAGAGLGYRPRYDLPDSIRAVAETR